MAGEDIVDAEWEDVPDGTTTRVLRPVSRKGHHHAGSQASQHPPIEPPEKSVWLERDFWRDLVASGGKFVMRTLLLAGVLFVLLIGIGIWEISHEARPSTPPLSGEENLSEWTAFVTGSAGTSGIALIDGNGEPGEFCSSASNAAMMSFGQGKIDGKQAYGFFSWMPAERNSAVLGIYQFDPATGRLHLSRLYKGEMGGDRYLNDITLQARRVAPGVVEIANTLYHTCVL